MVTIKIKKIEDEHIDGILTCREKTTNEKIKITLPPLGKDGVIIYKDGKIDIGGPRPPIEYYTNNPLTDEITINITGWFHIYYELIITEYDDYTIIQCINKDQID